MTVTGYEDQQTMIISHNGKVVLRRLFGKKGKPIVSVQLPRQCRHIVGYQAGFADAADTAAVERESFRVVQAMPYDVFQYIAVVVIKIKGAGIPMCEIGYWITIRQGQYFCFFFKAVQCLVELIGRYGKSKMVDRSRYCCVFKRKQRAAGCKSDEVVAAVLYVQARYAFVKSVGGLQVVRQQFEVCYVHHSRFYGPCKCAHFDLLADFFLLITVSYFFFVLFCSRMSARQSISFTSEAMATAAAYYYTYFAPYGSE